jgi:hypothetical protein
MPATIANTGSIGGDPSTVTTTNDKFLYVTVAGVDYYEHYGTPNTNVHNRARFINQAIRSLRENNAAKRQQNRPQDRCVFIIFRGMEGEDIERAHFIKDFHNIMKKFLHDWHQLDGKDYVILDTAQGLVDYINKYPAEGYRIKKLDIFTHGGVGRFWFGYKSPPEMFDAYEFKMELHAPLLKADAFAKGSLVSSFSCQTGNTYSLLWTPSDVKESLAQHIAEAARVSVKAFIRLTNYDQTYKDAPDLRKVRQDSEYIKWREYKLAEEKNRSENQPLPPEPDMPVPGKDGKWAEARRQEILADRKTRFPILRDGAMKPVRAGDTPPDRPSEMYLFRPGRKAEVAR